MCSAVWTAQGMQCGQHRVCSVDSTEYAVWTAQGMQCGQHRVCSVDSTGYAVWTAQSMQCGQHRVCSVDSTGYAVWTAQGMQCGQHRVCSVDSTGYAVWTAQSMQCGQAFTQVELDSSILLLILATENLEYLSLCQLHTDFICGSKLFFVKTYIYSCNIFSFMNTLLKLFTSLECK